MEKDKKNSSKNKESEKKEKKLEDKNVLPPKIFSSQSQNRIAAQNSRSSHSQSSMSKQAKNAGNTTSKSPEQVKSKNSAKDYNETDEKNTCKKAHVDPDHSKPKQKPKRAHFEDDILTELKREFPTNNSKNKKKVSYQDEIEDEKNTNKAQKPARDDDTPKARARSNAIKQGLYTEPELPDMPSQDIVVEKGGGSVGQNLMGQKGFVSSLLFDVVSQENTHPIKESKSKPVSKQSLLERRSTVMAVGSEISTVFEKKPGSKTKTMLSKTKAARSTTSASGRK